MSEGDFEEFVRQQHVFQPTHGDFIRLVEIMDQVEMWKKSGANPESVYAELMDTYSVAYMSANRAWLHVPDEYTPKKELAEYGANSWMEGFLFGLLFQQKGGHHPEGK